MASWSVLAAVDGLCCARLRGRVRDRQKCSSEGCRILNAFRTYSPAGRHPLGCAKGLSAYTPEYFEKPYSKY